MPWIIKMTQKRSPRNGKPEGFDVNGYLASEDLLPVQVRNGHAFAPRDKVIVWKATGHDDSGGAIALAEVESIPNSRGLVQFHGDTVVEHGKPRIGIKITHRSSNFLNFSDLESCLSRDSLEHWQGYRIGKSYPLTKEEYESLLRQARDQTAHKIAEENHLQGDDSDAQWALIESPAAMEQAKLELRRARENQTPFRRELINAYGCQCAITGCTVDAALEAAHIVPYSGPASQFVNNGLLLRADVHRLFDGNLIWVDPDDFTIKIDSVLAKTEYRELAGRKLTLPAHSANRPAARAFRLRSELLKEPA